MMILVQARRNYVKNGAAVGAESLVMIVASAAAENDDDDG